MEWFMSDDLFGINQIYVGKFFAERLHCAVKEGDIDEVEELLEEPGSDINSCYYGENLLWTAIMNKEEEMATFLIDNGIDTTFKSCRIELREEDEETAANESVEKKPKIKINLPNTQSSQKKQSEEEDDESEVTATADVFVVDCRQLAYEKEMMNIVNLIDYKQGCLLRTLKPPNHVVRLIKSARYPNNKSLADVALPPDRMRTKSANIHKRKYRKLKNKRETTLKPNSPGKENETVLPPNNEEAGITNISQVAQLNAAYQEDLVAERKVSVAVLSSRTRRVFNPLSESGSHRHRQNSAMIRLTKTAMMRYREGNNNSAADEQQYSLRHPENVEITCKTPTIPGVQAEFERRIARSGQCFSLPPRPVRKTMSTSTSYGNHLPFRRKPPLPLYNQYIDNVLRRSLHGYQHTQHTAYHQIPGRFTSHA